MHETKTLQIFNETLDFISNNSDEIKKFPVYPNDIFPNKLMSFFNWGLKLFGSRAIIVLERDDMAVIESIKLIKMIIDHFNKFDEVRDLLQNEQSKEIFNWVLQYRISYAFIGGSAIYLFNSPVKSKDGKNAVKILKKLKRGNYLHINGFKILINTEIKDPNILYVIAQNWLFNQYEYEGICIPQSGDIIFDIGACAGETAIWFISKINRKGRIYAFEPDEINYKYLVQNIELNNLQNLIIPIKYGLWETNQLMKFSNSGGENRINSEGDVLLKVVRLDDFVKQQKIIKVDYIKMDIEGAEMEALKGSIETIKKYKPKLAISIYHKASDIIEIPLFLSSLVPEYKFCMKHVSRNLSETVLFANI